MMLYKYIFVFCTSYGYKNTSYLVLFDMFILHKINSCLFSSDLNLFDKTIQFSFFTFLRNFILVFTHISHVDLHLSLPYDREKNKCLCLLL